MQYTKFTIAYFRGFKEKQTLYFASPISGEPGSGITYIVGENNSGKTTIIEGMFMHDLQKIRSSERQSDGLPLFELYAKENVIENENPETANEVEVIKRKLTLIRESSYTLTENPKVSDNLLFEIIPSRRHWQSGVTGARTIEQVVQETVKQTPRSTRSTARISDALQAIESNNEQFKEFIAFVQNVIPEFSSFAIGYEDAEYIEYVTNDGIKHKSDFLGDGIISLLRILVHLFKDSTQPLVIDEPELSLHPLAQKRLLQLIAECAQRRQIIISTHSPYFISWEYLQNGAVLNKVTKHKDNTSEIHTMNSCGEYEKLINGANWQQPFLMDTVAKEIFFHDNLLFTEGQEDVGLLKKDNQLSISINLFGYGVRGKDSFKFALQLAKDIGIRKAAVILDGGESESEIKTDLEKCFSDVGYKIIQWDKEDIRDKEEYTSSSKDGYFDNFGDKKLSPDSEDFDQKISELNIYFLE